MYKTSFRTITASYYRGAHGILLVYDVTNEQSFQSITTWLKDVQQYANEHVSIVLCGNKADLNHKRQVSYDQGKQLAKDLGLDFFETSAKTSDNVNAAFEKIIRNVIQKQNFLKNSIGAPSIVDGPSSTRKLENPSGASGASSGGCCWDCVAINQKKKKTNQKSPPQTQNNKQLNNIFINFYHLFMRKSKLSQCWLIFIVLFSSNHQMSSNCQKRHKMSQLRHCMHLHWQTLNYCSRIHRNVHFYYQWW